MCSPVSVHHQAHLHTEKGQGHTTQCQFKLWSGVGVAAVETQCLNGVGGKQVS